VCRPELACGGSVVTRRAVTCGKEVGDGGGEVRRWPDKPERNRSRLDQTRPNLKLPRWPEQRKKAMTR
jgi:hypothetical protein